MYTHSCSERTDCATTAILHKQSWLFRFWKPNPLFGVGVIGVLHKTLQMFERSFLGKAGNGFPSMMFSCSMHQNTGPVSWPVFLFVRPASFLN